MREAAALPIFSNKTLIPISMLGVLVPAMFWIVRLDNMNSTNERDIKELKDQRESFEERLTSKIDDQARTIGGIRVDIAGIDAKTSLIVDYLSGRRSATRGGH